jgi:hypothetical protein
MNEIDYYRTELLKILVRLSRKLKLTPEATADKVITESQK